MCVVSVLRMPLAAASTTLKELPLLFRHGKLYKENALLKQKVKELENLLLQLQEASKENQRLRGLLNFKARSKYRSIPAQLIARDLTFYSDVAIIDKGKKDSVKPDMAVISGDGLVGRVIEAGPSASKVLLLTDSNFRCAALVQRTRDEGIIEGVLPGNCRLKFLTLDADVKVKDVVVTSGLGGSVPKGILIGEIVSVKSEKAYLSKFAYIKPAADISKLEEVLCVE